jgi:hypothetical protein
MCWRFVVQSRRASLPLAAGILCLGAWAGDWPQFRGPNCTGVAAADAKPPVEFGPEKNVRWKTELPPGASSPVIAGDRIFLTGFANEKLETLALKRSDPEAARGHWGRAVELNPRHQLARANLQTLGTG